MQRSPSRPAVDSPRRFLSMLLLAGCVDGSAAFPDGGVGTDVVPTPSSCTQPGPGEGPPVVRLSARTDDSNPAKPEFSWSGSAMVARFEGTGATVNLEGSPNQFQVVIDGAIVPPVLKVVAGTTRYTVAAGLPPGPHDLVIWKRTEGNQGSNRFAGLDIADGQLLPPPAGCDRRVEFYGDSITAGYGIDGAGPSCPWSADTENHYLTYAALAARELGADSRTIAWSGIGMYRNYGQSGPSADAMPAVYARTLAANAGKAWDFARWRPQAVVINLGTNDFSSKGDPGEPFRSTYLGFVKTVRGHYPDAHIVLSIGPMLDGVNLAAARGHLQAVITARATEGDARLSYVEFPVQQAGDGYGCDWHPSARTNAKMADVLVKELRARLGW